jgi:hypothetical protein
MRNQGLKPLHPAPRRRYFVPMHAEDGFFVRVRAVEVARGEEQLAAVNGHPAVHHPGKARLLRHRERPLHVPGLQVDRVDHPGEVGRVGHAPGPPPAARTAGAFASYSHARSPSATLYARTFPSVARRPPARRPPRRRPARPRRNVFPPAHLAGLQVERGDVALRRPSAPCSSSRSSCRARSARSPATVAPPHGLYLRSAFHAVSPVSAFSAYRARSPIFSLSSTRSAPAPCRRRG